MLRLTDRQRIAALDELAAMESAYITPQMAAPIIGCTAYVINLTVKDDIEQYGEVRSYGFPILKQGTRVKIERVPFVEYYRKLLGVKESSVPATEIPEALAEAIAQRVAEILFEKITAKTNLF